MHQKHTQCTQMFHQYPPSSTFMLAHTHTHARTDVHILTVPGFTYLQIIVVKLEYLKKNGSYLPSNVLNPLEV